MALDPVLSPAQRELRQQARDFAQSVLSTVRSLTRDLPTPDARFQATRGIYAQALRAGFLKRLVPESFGGGGAGLVDMALVAEEFYAEDVNVALTLFANLLGLMPIFLAGSAAQRARYITPFLACEGAPLAALANSEPGGTANFAAEPPFGTRTHARLEQDTWVIDGEKHWVSSATGWDGQGADLLCVVCRTPAVDEHPAGLSIFAVPGGTPGIELVHAIDTVGHRAHFVPRFRLRDVRVPRDALVGPLGRARDVVDASFSGTAAVVGAMAVGLMRRAFTQTLAFCRTDARGGPQPILKYPTVGYALADAKGALEACRSLTFNACAAMDRAEPAALELALHAKVFCSETAVRVITELMRVVGIESYDESGPLAGILQDALALPLFDGGNNGMRRRQLHEILAAEGYDPLATLG